MLRFLDGVLPLRSFSEQADYAKEIQKLEEEEPMPIMTTLEKVVRRQSRREGLLEGRQEGRQDERLAIARRMLTKGIQLDQVLDLTGLSQEEAADLSKS